MSYTTVALVRSNFKRFSNITIMTDATINHFITRVEGLMNGILYKVYQIPLLDVTGATPYLPEIITTISTDLVTARCLKWLYDSNQTEEIKPAKNLYDENIELLKSMVLKKPEILLPCIYRTGVSLGDDGAFTWGSTSGSDIYSTTFDASKNPYIPIFGLDDFADSKVDTRLTDDLYEDRNQ
jgi:hypothetical protein